MRYRNRCVFSQCTRCFGDAFCCWQLPSSGHYKTIPLGVIMLVDWISGGSSEFLNKRPQISSRLFMKTCEFDPKFAEHNAC